MLGDLERLDVLEDFFFFSLELSDGLVFVSGNLFHLLRHLVFREREGQ